MNAAPGFESLIEILQTRASIQPDAVAHVFLQDGERESGSITYRGLDQRARAIAATLQGRVTTGARALLLFPTGLDFVATFWGCVYAGVIAVPIQAPRPNESPDRLKRVIDDAGPEVAFVGNANLPRLQEMRLAGPSALAWLTTDAIEADASSSWQPPQTSAESTALLQYTSGSTGVPKGVMVSHENILHNSECIRMSFELTPESTSVTWLPAFHDMGLIDGLIQPVYTGFTGVVMPPTAFLQSPIRWLRAIARYKATHSGGPNFGYDLCLKKVTPEQRDELDLSSWKSAYNGAEPVHAGTLARFAQHFAPAGFRAQSFYPCYGMAESTLMITGGLVDDEPKVFEADANALESQRNVRRNDSSPRRRATVGCGHPWLGGMVAVVDPESRGRCADGQIGEIWTRGPSVAQGYWGREKETKETFGARLSGGEGPFLRTGDLGFLWEDELYVTGRLKDMLIIRGQNYYPQDIERVVEGAFVGFRPSGGAAFTVGGQEGEQRLVVLQEIERTSLRSFNAKEGAKAVRLAVSDDFGLQVSDIVFVRPLTLPKTSSGKTQRRESRERYLARTLAEVGETPASLLDS